MLLARSHDRYHSKLGMWDDDGSEFRELYVDDNVFVWQRGPRSLFVVKSGMGYQPSIPLNTSAILPGTNACLMEAQGTGVRGTRIFVTKVAVFRILLDCYVRATYKMIITALITVLHF